VDEICTKCEHYGVGENVENSEGSEGEQRRPGGEVL
jgi:hypothetical protein